MIAEPRVIVEQLLASGNAMVGPDAPPADAPRAHYAALLFQAAGQFAIAAALRDGLREVAEAVRERDAPVNGTGEQA